MRVYHFLLLSTILFSCSSEQPESNSQQETIKHLADSMLSVYAYNFSLQYMTTPKQAQMLNDTPVVHKNLLSSIRYDGMMEKQRAENKYGDHRYSEKLLDSLAYVKAYPIQEMNEGGSPFIHRMTSGRFIPIKDFQEVVTLIKSRNSYGYPVAACFYPKIGLIMYDADDTPLGYISICMSCNQFHSSLKTPSMEHGGVMGFNPQVRQRLRELFFSWKFDYYGYSSFVDDSTAYQTYLQNKKTTPIVE